jgi:hypothetical protein
MNGAEKEDFRRLVNYLFSHTYIVRFLYQSSKETMLPNRDYQFVSRHFDLMQEYYQYAGWRLHKDENYGVAFIENEFGTNRLRLDRFTTLFLYMCRFIYEEQRMENVNYKTVKTTTSDIVERMVTYKLLEKNKSTQKERIEAQRTLSFYNIIQKMDSSPWNGEGNNILILPSILQVIPVDAIEAMSGEINDMKLSGEAEDGE